MKNYPFRFPPRNTMTENYTMVSNELFDELLPLIKNQSDLKILLVIYRYTFGYTKDVVDGQVVYKENVFMTTRELAEKTGMAQANIVAGIKRLLEQGFIVRIKKDGKYGYKLKIQGEEAPIQES